VEYLFLHLACQGGRFAHLSAISYATGCSLFQNSGTNTVIPYILERVCKLNLKHTEDREALNKRFTLLISTYCRSVALRFIVEHKKVENINTVSSSKKGKRKCTSNKVSEQTLKKKHDSSYNNPSSYLNFVT